MTWTPPLELKIPEPELLGAAGRLKSEMLPRWVVVLVVVVASLAAASPVAYGKGWSGPSYFVPGDPWHRRAEVRFRSIDGLREAMRTKYFAYMIDASYVRVAPVFLERDKEDRLTLRAEARFVIPNVPMGRYVVTFCTLGCRAALGRFSPTFHVRVVEDEPQRALFSWLDDWLQQRRGLKFFEGELSRVASMTEVMRRSDATQEWHLRSLKERVNTLEAREPGTGSLSWPTFILALVGGALGWIGTRIVAARMTRVRKRAAVLRA